MRVGSGLTKQDWQRTRKRARRMWQTNLLRFANKTRDRLDEAILQKKKKKKDNFKVKTSKTLSIESNTDRTKIESNRSGGQPNSTNVTNVNKVNQVHTPTKREIIGKSRTLISGRLNAAKGGVRKKSGRNLNQKIKNEWPNEKKMGPKNCCHGYTYKHTHTHTSTRIHNSGPVG